jgi:DNA-binding PadR family transcriptional regulator
MVSNSDAADAVRFSKANLCECGAATSSFICWRFSRKLRGTGTPRHGYEIISELEKQSGGYRPSPGSVYPTLQMLEEGGYLTSEQIDGKKVYTITEEGLKLLEERGATKFEAHPKMAQAFEMRKSLMKLSAAVMDGTRDGDEETVKRINEIVNKARRDVYSILAES